MKVRDFIFGFEDMVTAIQSRSLKYADKLNSMNKLARMVLEYYIKYLNDISIPPGGFDRQYVAMLTDISRSASGTKNMFGNTVVTSTLKSELRKNVEKSKKDILAFYGIFSRDGVINFRNMFIQAIYRQLQQSGISKINEEQIGDILIQMTRKTDNRDPIKPVSQTVPIAVTKKGDTIAVSQGLARMSGGSNLNIDTQSVKDNKDGDSRALTTGGTILDVQSGGVLSDIFGTENYNLMAPMCMFSEGTGLNNMVVRITKRFTRNIDTSSVGEDAAPATSATPDDSAAPDDSADQVIGAQDNSHNRVITSEDKQDYVDIQVGDAIRFVYKGKITYAIVCGFKPGKKIDKKGNDEEMNMTDFRKTNIDIMASMQSHDLQMTPAEFLNVITLRGIKYLTFEYDDDLYSFADWNTREAALRCRNDELKAGLSAKFTFRCDQDKIPFLPNGYRYPTSRKYIEAFKKGLKTVTFGSTEADIGKDFNLPEYSLSSYMTLDKVITPLNFDPVINLLKSKNDDDLNNADSILKELIKEMEKYGLNTSAGCIDNTSKIKSSSLLQRRAEFIRMSDKIGKEFNATCIVNGIINREKAVNLMRNLYARVVEQNIFVNEKGIPYKTVPQIVFLFYFMRKNFKVFLQLLITALSAPNIQDINTRRKELGSAVQEQNTQSDRYSDELEGGTTPSEATAAAAAAAGAEGSTVSSQRQTVDSTVPSQTAAQTIPLPTQKDIRKAEDIIKYSIDMIGKQGLLHPTLIQQYYEELTTVAANYDAKEEAEKMASSSKMITSMSNSSMGYNMTNMSNMSNMSNGPHASSSSNFLGNFFSKLGMKNALSASGMGMGIGNDSCGNNTSIVCNGDDLVVTVTLKLNELIASCMNPEMIQNISNHPTNLIGNGENQNDDVAAAEAKAAAEANAANPIQSNLDQGNSESPTPTPTPDTRPRLSNGGLVPGPASIPNQATGSNTSNEDKDRRRVRNLGGGSKKIKINLKRIKQKKGEILVVKELDLPR